MRNGISKFSKKFGFLYPGVFTLILLSLIQIAWAAEEVEGGTYHSPSWVYYVEWSILVAIFLLGVAYLLRLVRLGKPSQRKTGLGALLVTLIFLYFVLGYHPTLSSFHEASILGFLRFVLMSISGILIVIYGILGKPSEYQSSSSPNKK